MVDYGCELGMYTFLFVRSIVENLTRNDPDGSPKTAVHGVYRSIAKDATIASNFARSGVKPLSGKAESLADISG